MPDDGTSRVATAVSVVTSSSPPGTGPSCCAGHRRDPRPGLPRPDRAWSSSSTSPSRTSAGARPTRRAGPGHHQQPHARAGRRAATPASSPPPASWSRSATTTTGGCPASWPPRSTALAADPDARVRQLRHPGQLRRPHRGPRAADGPGRPRRPAAGPAHRAAPVDVPDAPGRAARRVRAGRRGDPGQLRARTTSSCCAAARSAPVRRPCRAVGVVVRWHKRSYFAQPLGDDRRRRCSGC